MKPKKLKFHMDNNRPVDDQWTEARMQEYNNPNSGGRSVPSKYLHEADDPELLYKRKTAELVMIDTLEKVSAKEEITDENRPRWFPPKPPKPRPTFWSRITRKTRIRMIVAAIIIAAAIYAVYIWHTNVSPLW